MSVANKFFFIAFVAFFGFLFIALHSVNKSHLNSLPKVQMIPPDQLLKKSVRVSDLFSIAVALEKYKQDNNSYPVSYEWSNLFKFNGDLDLFWIKGLSPKYMESLPRDPRMHSVRSEQYAYKSNGANYKLLSYYPDDCEEIGMNLPALAVIREGECIGYGFWTSDSF